jgi:hypothetical protein
MVSKVGKSIDEYLEEYEDKRPALLLRHQYGHNSISIETALLKGSDYQL